MTWPIHLQIIRNFSSQVRLLNEINFSVTPHIYIYIYIYIYILDVLVDHVWDPKSSEKDANRWSNNELLIVLKSCVGPETLLG